MGHADKQSLDFFLVSAKRTRAERSGVHGWHPYYAGYSEAFVESGLRHLECTSDMVLLDPWAGSGTSCIVASRFQIPAVGIDINPVMATFTAAKSPAVLACRGSIDAFFRTLPETVPSNAACAGDSLLRAFSSETVGAVRGIWQAINGHKRTPLVGGALDVEQAFLSAVLFVTLRKLSGLKKMSNPTWVGGGEGEQLSVPVDVFYSALAANANTMWLEVEAFYGACEFPREIYSFNADVAHMPIVDGSIDRVITSPPYLTRIDYAVSTSPELSILGDEELFRSVRHATTGAPVITSRPKEQRSEWGPTCNDILNQVKSHSSKAALGYYWKNMVQYFDDIERALRDIWRVLKVGGSGLVVVQSSYFKAVEIPLGDIFVEMAKAQGFQASIAYRDEVKNHMAHVNTKSNGYFPNKVYFEDTVLIQKP